MSRIDWLPWATPAFQRAQQTRRPVLLLIETAWSTPCREFLSGTLESADVAETVSGRFVAVRVDADWRPDIADRYGAGSWPTLLALTPEGDVLGGGTPPPRGLAPWLVLAATRFTERDGRWLDAGDADHSRQPVQPAHMRDPVAAAQEVWATLAAAVDPQTGRFGTGHGPVLEPALAALAAATTGLVPDLAAPAVRTLDALLAGPRWERARGLLLSRGIDATEPGERLARLGEQAEWVRLLARAVAWDPRPPWHAALRQASAALHTAFGPAAEGWTAWTDGPPVTFTDQVARGSRALLAAAEVLDAPELAAEAIAALEATVPRVYTQGAGVAHVWTHRPHGPALLLDAMLVAHALLDADPWRSQPVYRDLAEELVRSACARLAGPSGALLDRRATMAGANDVGRLRQPVYPLDGNGEAARACLRLGPGSAEWQARALAVLSGVHEEGRQAGAFSAPLALAWTALLAPDHPISVW